MGPSSWKSPSGGQIPFGKDDKRVRNQDAEEENTDNCSSTATPYRNC